MYFVLLSYLHIFVAEIDPKEVRMELEELLVTSAVLYIPVAATVFTVLLIRDVWKSVKPRSRQVRRRDDRKRAKAAR